MANKRDLKKYMKMMAADVAGETAFILDYYDNIDENKAYMWYITFAKEYDGIFNEYQSVNMTIIPKINKVTRVIN